MTKPSGDAVMIVITDYQSGLHWYGHPASVGMFYEAEIGPKNRAYLLTNPYNEHQLGLLMIKKYPNDSEEDNMARARRNLPGFWIDEKHYLLGSNKSAKTLLKQG